MKKLMLILLVLPFISCQEEIDCCVMIDNAVSIHYKDLDGIDLLDPDNQESFSHSQIKIYFEVNGAKEYAFNGNLDNPNYHLVAQNTDGSYFLKVFANDQTISRESITYIELGESTTDTLKILFQSSSESLLKEKVWYNNKLKYDISQGSDPFITIEK